MSSHGGTLLCVANYPTNTGYAWDLIERIYARVADHLATHGVRTLVAYPAIPSPPRTLEGSAAEPIVLDASLATRESVRAVVRAIRAHDIRAVYFTDRPARSWAYLALRRAGVRHIVVHDHTSGARTAPRGVRRAAKLALARVPGIVADTVLAVSDYVARRQVEVGLLPASRVVRVHNGLAAPARNIPPDGRVQRELGVAEDRPVIVAASRASAEKGIVHLLRAFDNMLRESPTTRPRPVLLYAGDGPQLPALRALRESLAAREDIVLAGYRRDAAALVEGATLCVVPSVWQDAFPTSVLEALMRGRPVIATRVGGIPEMIEDGVTGVLVEPGDEAALARAMRELLDDPARAERLGRAARERTVARFTPERQTLAIAAVLERGFDGPCAGEARSA